MDPNFPCIPDEKWTLTASTPEWLKQDPSFFQKVNAAKSPSLQALVHLFLIRKYKTRPPLPRGLWESVRKQYGSAGFVNIDALLGPCPPRIAGLAPQWRIMEQGLKQCKEFYDKHPHMSRFLLFSMNMGAGKTGLDPLYALTYRNGLPSWPTHGPPVLILSQSEAILKDDFLPYLQRRYPMLHPDCFQMLTSKAIKPKFRSQWLEKKNAEIRQANHGKGIYFLAMTPQLFSIEVKKFAQGKGSNLIPQLQASVKVLYLDEVDALGPMSASKKTREFKAVGNPGRILDTLRTLSGGGKKGTGIQSLALAYFMARMREVWGQDHLIMGLSATIAHAELKNAIPNYVALAGGTSDVYDSWQKQCIMSHLEDFGGEVHVQIERCQMSALDLKVHNLVMACIITQLEKSTSSKAAAGLQSRLVQHCLSSSGGADVMLDKDSMFQEGLSLLTDGKELLQQLQEENKKERNPMVLAAVNRCLSHLRKDPKNKAVVFYSRIVHADTFRRLYCARLREEFPSLPFDFQNVGIISGTRRYPLANFTNAAARLRLETAQAQYGNQKLLSRMILMSCKCGRGQNLGAANLVVMMGAMTDTKSFVQDLGRILRADRVDPKHIYHVIPQADFSGSERSLGYLLKNIYCQGDAGEKLWRPLAEYAVALAKTLRQDVTIQAKADYTKNRKKAHSLYSDIMEDWKHKRKQLKRAEEETENDSSGKDEIASSAEESDLDLDEGSGSARKKKARKRKRSLKTKTKKRRKKSKRKFVDDSAEDTSEDDAEESEEEEEESQEESQEEEEEEEVEEEIDDHELYSEFRDDPSESESEDHPPPLEKVGVPKTRGKKVIVIDED